MLGQSITLCEAKGREGLSLDGRLPAWEMALMGREPKGTHSPPRVPGLCAQDPPCLAPLCTEFSAQTCWLSEHRQWDP